MSSTPSDPGYVNPKALEGFARAFDRVISSKYNLPQNVQPQITVVEACQRSVREVLMRKPSLWRKLSPLKAIRRLRDDLRLRKYNRQWTKNNIH